MSKADMWDTPNKEPTETKAKVGDTPTIIPPQANTLDEIDNKMFNLNGLAHIVTRDKIAIQALITEARIDEWRYFKEYAGGYDVDRSYSRNKIYVIDQQDVDDRLTQLKENK